MMRRAQHSQARILNGVLYIAIVVVQRLCGSHVDWIKLVSGMAICAWCGVRETLTERTQRHTGEQNVTYIKVPPQHINIERWIIFLKINVAKMAGLWRGPMVVQEQTSIKQQQREKLTPAWHTIQWLERHEELIRISLFF